MGVPFNAIKTDDPQLERIQTAIGESFDQVPTEPVALVAAVAANFTVTDETAVVVLATAPNATMITLPDPTDAYQLMVINRSKHDVKLQTADARTVFPALSAGASGTVVSDGNALYSTTGAAV